MVEESEEVISVREGDVEGKPHGVRQVPVYRSFVDAFIEHSVRRLGHIVTVGGEHVDENVGADRQEDDTA